MSINELLGWAMSIITTMQLQYVVPAAFVILLAVAVIRRFAGGRE